MAICRDISSFARVLGHPRALLGLDLGEKTIGVAAADALFLAATPLVTISRTRFTQDVTILSKLAGERTVGGVVLGYPVNMNGSEGPRCQSTRQFAHNLFKALQLPILLWDERTSSQAADRAMLEADLSRARREELIDKLAASLILQGAMEALRGQFSKGDFV